MLACRCKCVSRSSRAVVISASPNMHGITENERLVVIITLMCSYNLESSWKRIAPPVALAQEALRIQPKVLL